jgi:hypothetical protein
MKKIAVLVAFLCCGAAAWGQEVVPIVAGVVTMDVDQTITSVVFPNPTAGEVVNVIVVQNTTGGYSVTFGGNIANAPTVNTTPSSSSSVLLSYDINSNAWYGVNNGGIASPSNVQGLNNTFGVPPASPATIETITNAGGISTMNCDIADCGLTMSEQIELGTSVPLSCQGPQTITAVSGNSASFASTTCAATGGPYTSKIGKWASPVQFCNSVAPGSCTQVSLQYDGAFELLTYGSGTPRSFLVLDTDSVAALVGQNGGSFVTDINGDTCLVGDAIDEFCTHQAEVFNADGKMTRYDTQPLDAGPYSHGLNADLAQLNPGLITGDYARTTLYTTNSGTNFGGQGWYEVSFQAIANANVSGATVTFEVVYADPDYGTVASIYLVACNMSFAANTRTAYKILGRTAAHTSSPKCKCSETGALATEAVSHTSCSIRGESTRRLCSTKVVQRSPGAHFSPAPIPDGCISDLIALHDIAVKTGTSTHGVAASTGKAELYVS